MNPYDIIFHFYPEDTPLRRLLILHSEKVRDKALEILSHARLRDEKAVLCNIDEQLVSDGALLHDIGIGRTHAPSILCEGKESYICHGTIGADMIRQEYCAMLASDDGSSSYLEAIARICERHTGSGLTRQDIVDQNLPISPVRDLLPETLEEQLVCLADKFYSKSGDPSKEKNFDRVCRSMMKFGTASMERFEALCRTFYLK